MGDGSLIVNSSHSNYRLQVEHSSHQKEYVLWKYGIFRNFVLTEPKYLPRTRSWKFRTISHPELSTYHRMFYRAGRKILPEDIGFLTDPFIAAVWFMDDGGRFGNGCLLNIQNFTDEEALRLRKFFRDTFEIPATLQRNHGRFRLYIPTSHRVLWEQYIGKYVRGEFRYKISQAP